MNKKLVVLSAIFCMVIMINNSVTISAYYSDIIPRGTIAVNNNFVDVNEPAHFRVDNPKNILSVAWFFHDGTDPIITQSLNITHQFGFEGIYLVTVQMFGTGGIMSQSSIEITVENLAPSAEISIPTTAYEDENVTLAVGRWNDGVYDNESLIFQWLLGDTTTKSGSRIQYSWAYAGIYPITLIAFDDQRAVGYDYAFITIMNRPPVAVIESNSSPSADNKIYLAEDALITLSAYQSYDTPSDMAKELSYFWDFGNGEVAKGIEVDYKYPVSGTYNITLTVMDDDGAKGTDKVTVVVQNYAPTIEIQEDKIIIEEGETHTFTAIASDNYTDYNRLQYLWSFGQQGWRASNTYFDNYQGTEYVLVSDPEGENAIDFIDVNVINVPPRIALTRAYVITNITFRVAGTPGNDVQFVIYEDNRIVVNISISRNPGDPDIQSVEVPMILDLSKTYRMEGIWTNPPHGANPAWITFRFPEDWTGITLFHNFNGQHPLTHHWIIDPAAFMDVMPITFEGYIFDPGTDELGLEILFDNIPVPFTSSVESTWPSVLTFSLTQIPYYGSHRITVNAWDDDGGSDSLSISILDVAGKLKIEDLSPSVRLMEDLEVYEGIPINFWVNVSDYGPHPITNMTWEFGDGWSACGDNVTHRFSNEGIYLVRCVVSDGTYNTVKSTKVHVVNYKPAPIINGIFHADEDTKLTFRVIDMYIDTPSDQASLQFFWEFGDGVVGAGPEVVHSYPLSGNYTIRLFALDDDGIVGVDSQMITIDDLPPLITGPFAFESIEGNLLIAEVFVDDSILDSQHLDFNWFLENSSTPITTRIFSQWYSNANLSAWLVINETFSNLYAETLLTFHFLNTPPIPIVQSKMLYGVKQPLTLRAYAVDSFLDIDNLEFTWHIGDNSFIIPGGVGRSSELNWTFANTSLYSGFVEVFDGVSTYSAKFSVAVTYDADGDNIIDELEFQQGTNSSLEDTDGDFITDWYEWEVYKTSPLSPDSDNDGLYDGFDPRPGKGKGELYLGTNPLKNDTDYDNLTDGFEVYGWQISVSKTYPNGIQWVDTYNATSNPLLIDSDHDNLTDWEEWYYTTVKFDPAVGALDPLRADTDEDGASDWKELTGGLAPGIADSDGDKVLDSQEQEGYFVTLLNGTRYHVITNSSRVDTDFDGLDDWEERNPGKDGRLTDATKPDTDGDGLNDSAEVCSIERGYYGRHNIQNGEVFEFEAVLGNHAQNATLLVGISTNSSAYVTMSVYAWKVGKPYALKQTNFQINSTNFYFNATDITKYTTDFAGRWRLQVSTNGRCMLENFKIQVSYLLDPLNPDCDNDGLTDGQELNPTTPGATGWITNPKARDSDGDGWNDYYETKITGTNPLSKDTDGDGANDPSDRDPLYNLVLEVYVERAHFEGTYWSSPVLTVVVSVEGQSAVAAYRPGSEDSDIRGMYLWVPYFDWGSWQWKWARITIAEWTVWETAYFGMRYYFDVPDWKATISVDAALWNMWVSNEGDKIFSQSKSYTVGTHSNPNQLSLSYASGSSWAKLSVKTIGLERVNTIAIYSQGQFTNGHYASMERVNVILLEVVQAGGLFTAGMNAIIIPTSAYLHTKLHSLIETSVTGVGVNMTKLPVALRGDATHPAAEFTGVNRAEESVSEYVETLITRKQVSLADAQAILDLLLCNETGYVINLASKAKAETLGVAKDILDLIPWDGKTYQNSGQGQMP